ncbi:alanine--tRNA ligase [bacterium]|nr:alanine--tRNA ligase [bacterium]
MKLHEIRARFLQFFAERGHTVVPSSTLVPQDDPTLLFTNAGMNQFKAVFTGVETRDYKRAASCQKCMRVSGKHNDLEEVGKDARHHTFFEMLGNWSFGDYYKKESLTWGYEFLVDDMGLDPARLWYTVYKDDDEAHGIFHDDLGIPAGRILRLGDVEQGDEENFWSMGEVGPCGPCAEIHFDQGETMACDHPDGCAVGVCDCDRWLELWNHVFMQYDRDASGTLTPLPMQSVDTGLGLERLAAVLQSVDSNYKTDLFERLIACMAEACGRQAEGDDRVHMQVIADHARAVAFTLADGATPSNADRGYVIRRILRRALRHGYLLGMEEPFLYRVADEVIAAMGDAYPELVEQRDRVLTICRQEEERFLRTLGAGMKIYAEMRDRTRAAGGDRIAGEDAFKLHDTFGFPVDLTAVMAEEDGLGVDLDGYEACMDRQRAQSGRERVFMQGIGAWRALGGHRLASEFIGHDDLEADTVAVGVRSGGEDEQGPLAHVLLARSPFYPEGGGQIGDHGVLVVDGQDLPVLTTVKSEEGPALVVRGTADELASRLDGAAITARVLSARRLPTMRHHTATHLVHAALRRVLGDHVEQAGSEVTPDRLRFDFRHDRPLTREQIARVEDLVQRAVLDNQPVLRREDVPLAEAKSAGAMALFGEKYGDTVRMIEIPGGPCVAAETGLDDGETYSLELCGGTHVDATGDIGHFRIVSEGSVAAGVRRIEAVAGEAALALDRADRDLVDRLGDVLRRDGEPYLEQIEALREERDQLRKQLQAAQQASAREGLEEALASPREVGAVRLVVSMVSAENRDALLQLGDHVRDKLQSDAVAVLGAMVDGKAALLVTVTGDLVESKTLHAGNLVKDLASRVGGRGGGRPGTAQAGLPDRAALDAALDAAADVVGAQLG